MVALSEPISPAETLVGALETIRNGILTAVVLVGPERHAPASYRSQHLVRRPADVFVSSTKSRAWH